MSNAGYRDNDLLMKVNIGKFEGPRMATWFATGIEPGLLSFWLGIAPCSPKAIFNISFFRLNLKNYTVGRESQLN